MARSIGQVFFQALLDDRDEQFRLQFERDATQWFADWEAEQLAARAKSEALLAEHVRGVLSDRAADVELARAGHRYVLPSLATSVAWRCAGGYSRAEIWDELKRQLPEVFA
jgi:3-phenylpropionate/cinnamic acid dioxygenase small subunit